MRLPKALDEQAFAAQQTRRKQLLNRLRDQRPPESLRNRSRCPRPSRAHFDQSVVARLNRARGESSLRCPAETRTVQRQSIYLAI